MRSVWLRAVPDSVGEVGAEILEGEPRLPQVDVDPVLEGVRLDLDPILFPTPAAPQGLQTVDERIFRSKEKKYFYLFIQVSLIAENFYFRRCFVFFAKNS